MLIVARPSISTYLARTLSELRLPAVLTEEMTIPMRPAIRILSPSEFSASTRTAYRSLLLTNSENALSHLYDVIPYDDRVMKARLFKDKVAFRRAIARKFPAFFFREFTEAEILKVDPLTLPFPVVLKPAVGISSIGVIRVGSAEEWSSAVTYLLHDLESYRRNYSASVVEGEKLLCETYIEGREFAIDGYFDESGEPVILNVLEHLFLNAQDTSDRIYLTHRSLIASLLEPLEKFLREFGEIFDLKRFPFHLELRQTPSGELIPIEVNPLRFAGMGTTEIAQYAYGINVYESFFRQLRPDWKSLLAREDDSFYVFLCADIPTELFRSPGLQIDDRGFSREFSEVLEYRIQDEQETSTFAVVFFRTPSLDECRKFLAMDFRRFLTPRTS
jgi:hypothetical protein